MPSFQYVAIDRSGKKVREKIEASSLTTAQKSIRAAGYTVLEIKELGVLSKDIDLPFLGNPKAKDMAIFCRQFSSILRAGVPVSTVLSMLAQQTENKKLAAAIRDMQGNIEKGETLAGSMRRHPRIFSGMLTNMVAAGEESGNLEAAFRQMEVWFDKAKRTRNAITKAMIYPSILLTVMVIVMIVMMVKIIPSFLSVFTEMNMELPAVTKAVVAVSDWFSNWYLYIIGGIILIVLFATQFRKTNRGMHFFGFLAIKTPMVKNLTVRSACATFSRTLALLLGSGLTLLDSLDLVAQNMRNVYFREAVLKVRIMTSEGWSLLESMRQTRVFPPMLYNMTGIGEEAGDLQGMLEKTADYYDDEVEGATQKLLSMMEPMIILFLAVFVVILVLSIFLPMMSMNKAYDSYL